MPTSQTPNDEPHVRLVTYRLKEVFALKAKIQTDPEMRGYLGKVLAADDYLAVVKRLRDLLPPHIELKPLWESIIHWAGIPLTETRLRQEAWRLAGNVRLLRNGFPVPPWRLQERNEWIPLQIIDQVPYRNRKGHAGAVMTFRALAGPPAGLLAERFWTFRLGGFVARQIGFTAPFDKYPFERLQELTGMRLYGLVLAEKSVGKLFFDKVAAPQAVITYNRKLLKDRLREPGGFVCPHKYTHQCCACPVGYDKCHCAVHPRTYVHGVCDKCGKRAWMDPLRVSLRLCEECYIVQQLNRK